MEIFIPYIPLSLHFYRIAKILLMSIWIYYIKNAILFRHCAYSLIEFLQPQEAYSVNRGSERLHNQHIITQWLLEVRIQSISAQFSEKKKDVRIPLGMTTWILRTQVLQSHPSCSGSKDQPQSFMGFVSIVAFRVQLEKQKDTNTYIHIHTCM